MAAAFARLAVLSPFPSLTSLGGARAAMASCSPLAALFKLRLIFRVNLRSARSGVDSLLCTDCAFSLHVNCASDACSSAALSRLGVTTTSMPLYALAKALGIWMSSGRHLHAI